MVTDNISFTIYIIKHSYRENSCARGLFCGLKDFQNILLILWLVSSQMLLMRLNKTWGGIPEEMERNPLTFRKQCKRPAIKSDAHNYVQYISALFGFPPDCR